MDCEKGRYAATQGAWQCQQCDAGTYVHMDQCRKCPAFGVTCEQGLALAEKGYYVYPDEVAKAAYKYTEPEHADYFPAYVAYRCPANYCATENEPGVGENNVHAACAENREGVLCGECIEGHYPSGSKCYPCRFSNEGLLAIPFVVNWILVLFIFMTSRNDGSSFDGITKIFLFFIQTTTLFFTINKLGSDFAVFMAFFTFNSMAYMNFNVNDIGEGVCFQSTALLNLNTGIIQPLVSVFQLLIMLCIHFVYHLLVQRRNETREPFKTGPYRRAFVALFLFVFYSLASACVQILACQEVVWQGRKADPKERWGFKPSVVQDIVVVAAPSVSCQKYPYEYLKVVAIVILILMVVLALLSLVFVLIGYKKGFFEKWKDDQVDEYDKEINDNAHDPECAVYKDALQRKVDIETFYSNWSGVFRGYNYRHFYWEYVMFIRRSSVICIVSFLHEAYDRYFGLSLVCIGSLVLHVISYPFSEPREHIVNVRPGSLAWNILKGVNHLETMSLSVLALLVQLMLSDEPERDEILYTKVSLILFSLVTLGFSLIYVVWMERVAFYLCSKYVEDDKEDDNKVVEAVEDGDDDDKEQNLVLDDDDDRGNAAPQAVHEGEQDQTEQEQSDNQPQETNENDSDDLFAVHKPPKNTGTGDDGTGDDNTGEDNTGGDTLETDEVDGTGDTTNSDIDAALLNVEETNDDTLDKDLDAALVASAAMAASDANDKDGAAAKIASPEETHPDLDAALAASAEEAVLQASAEDIDLDDMMKQKK